MLTTTKPVSKSKRVFAIFMAFSLLFSNFHVAMADEIDMNEVLELLQEDETPQMSEDADNQLSVENSGDTSQNESQENVENVDDELMDEAEAEAEDQDFGMDCDFDIFVTVDGVAIDASHTDFSSHITYGDNQVIEIHTTERVTLANKSGVETSSQRIIVTEVGSLQLEGVTLYGDQNAPVMEVKAPTIITLLGDNTIEIAKTNAVDTVVGLEYVTFFGDGTMTIAYHEALGETQKEIYLTTADQFPQVTVKSVGREVAGPVIVEDVLFDDDITVFSGGVSGNALDGCGFIVTVDLGDGTVLEGTDSDFSNHVAFDINTNQLTIKTNHTVTIGNIDGGNDNNKTGSHSIVVAEGITDGANLIFDGVYMSRNTGTYSLMEVYSETNLTINKMEVVNSKSQADSTFLATSNGSTTKTIVNPDKLTITGEGKLAIFSPEADTYDYSQLGDVVLDYAMEYSADLGSSPSSVLGVVQRGTATAEIEYLQKDFSYDKTTKVLIIKSGNTFRILDSSVITRIEVAEGLTEAPTIILEGSALTFTKTSGNPIILAKSDANLLLKGNITFKNPAETCAEKMVVTENDSTVTIQNGNSTFTTWLTYFGAYNFASKTNNSLTLYRNKVSGTTYDDDISDVLLDPDVYIKESYELTLPNNGSLNFVVDILEPERSDEIIIGDTEAASTLWYAGDTGLVIKTDVPLAVSTKSGFNTFDAYTDTKGYRRLSIVVKDVPDGKEANLTLNGFLNFQQYNNGANIPSLQLNSPTNLSLSGTNVLQYDQRYGWTTDAYKPEEATLIDGIDNLLSVSGSGNLSLKTTPYIQSIDEEKLYAAVEKGGATGNIFVYEQATSLELAGLDYNITIVDDPDTKIDESQKTSDKLELTWSTDAPTTSSEYTINVTTSDAVIIGNQNESAYAKTHITIKDVPDGEWANIYFDNISRSIEDVGSADALIDIQSPTNLTILESSKSFYYAPDYVDTVAARNVPIIKTNSDIVMKGAGELELFSNVGFSLLETDGNNVTVSADPDCETMVYSNIYTDIQAVKDSDFTVAAHTEAPLAEVMDIVVQPAVEKFDDADFTFNEDGAKRLTLHNGDITHYITNKTGKSPTTNLLGIDAGVVTSPVSLLFDNVNIVLTSADEQNPPVPVLEVKSSTDITLLQGTDNYFTVPYDYSDTSGVPTIRIYDGNHLNIIETIGSSMTINHRNEAVTVEGSYNDDEITDSVVLQEVVLSSSEALTSGELVFDGTTVTVNTSKPVMISNKNINTVTEVFIVVAPNIVGGADVTLSGVNIYHSKNTAAPIVDLYSDTKLTIQNTNAISGMYINGVDQHSIIRVNNDATMTLNGNNSNTDQLYLTTRYHGEGIEVVSGGELHINGGYLKVSSPTSSIEGIKIGSEVDGHGDIYINGGVIDLPVFASKSFATLGGRSIGGNIYVTGGSLNFINTHTYDRTLIGVGSNSTSANGESTSFFLENSAIMTVTRNSNANLKNLYNFANPAQSVDWQGLFGIVNTSKTIGAYTVYGDTVLQNDFTLPVGHVMNFDVYGDTHISSFATGNHTFINNGKIVRDAYLDENPHIHFTPMGTGTIEIALTQDLISMISTEGGESNGYRGNSIFDYFKIQENGESLLGKADISVHKLENIYDDPTEENKLPGYTIDGIGSYKIVVSSTNTATTDEETTYSDLNQTVYTGNLTPRSLTVTAANLKDATVTVGNFNYRGLGNPYTEEELLAGIQVVLNGRILTTTDETQPDYRVALWDPTADNGAGGVYDGNKEFDSAVDLDILISAISEYDTTEDKQYYLDGQTAAVYEGYQIIKSGITIVPRGLTDPAVDITTDTQEDVVTSLDDVNSLGYIFLDETEDNKVSVCLTYTYRDNEGAWTTDTLQKDKDYTISYRYADTPIASAYGVNPITDDTLDRVGEVIMTIEAVEGGNFTGSVEKSYFIYGDLSSNKADIKFYDDETEITGEVTLAVSISGRLNFSEIKVFYDDTELKYLVDYVLEYTLNTSDGTIEVVATGIGNYVNKSIEKPKYKADGRVQLIDYKTYIKPDGTYDIDDIIRNIPIGVYFDHDDDTTKSDVLTKLVYGESTTIWGAEYTDYELITVGDPVAVNNSVIVTLDLKIRWESGSAANDYFFDEEFEFVILPAGSGTTKDFSEGAIYLVDAVYERPDGVLHFSDDIIIEANDGSGEVVTLEADTDYTMTKYDRNGAIATRDVDIVSVKLEGKGDFGGEITFNVDTAKTGTGTGFNLGKGIVDLIQTVTVTGEIADTVEEVKQNLEVSLYGGTTPIDVAENYFSIVDVDVKTDSTGKVISNEVTLTLEPLEYEIVTTRHTIGNLTGTTKEFTIIMKSESDFLDDENLYVRPDYSIDLSDIKLYHPGYLGQNREIEFGVDYTAIEAYWSENANSADYGDDYYNGGKNFVGVYITFTDSFLDEYPSLGASQMADGRVIFGAVAKDAGTGDMFAQGFLDYAPSVYKRPDGKFYEEDFDLTASRGEYHLSYGKDYSMSTNNTVTPGSIENPSENEYVGSIISRFNTNVTITGLGDYAGKGSVSFNMHIGEAGTGYGIDFDNGILHQTKTVYRRPDNGLYFDEDFIVEANDGMGDVTKRNRLVEGRDYTLTHDDAYTIVTVNGMGSYIGTTTYDLSTDGAGQNFSGSKSFAEGIIAPVQTIYEKEYPELSTTKEILQAGLSDDNLIVALPDETYVSITEGVDFTLVKYEDIGDVEVSANGSRVMTKRVYIEAISGSGYTGAIDFLVLVDIDNTRIDISTAEVEQADGTYVYQRPDGIYTYSKDLKLTIKYKTLDLQDAEAELSYPDDFIFVEEADGEYTIYGRGDYKGLKENVRIVKIDAGENTASDDVSKSVIDLISDAYVLERDSEHIELQNIPLTVKGGESFTCYTDYEIKLSENQDLPEGFVNGQDFTYYMVEVEGLGFDPNLVYIVADEDGLVGTITPAEDADVVTSFYGAIEFAVKVENYDAPTIAPPTTTPAPSTPNDGYGGGSVVTVPSITRSEAEAAKATATATETTVEDKFPFIDVFTSDWYYEDVKAVYFDGLMHGMSDTIFAPQNDTTRAMLVKILHNLEGNPTPNSDSGFGDVDSSSWYYDAVCWARENDIVAGITTTTFAPNEPITREQLVAMLHRYAIYKGDDNGERSELSVFVDSNDIASYAMESVQWANANEIVYGNTIGEFKPKLNATRAEIAAIVNRYVN